MHDETSPFVFDGPVPPAQLAGRDDELDPRAFCLLYGPRRFARRA